MKNHERTNSLTSRKIIAYVAYGLWVHFRVYPIIFLPLIFTQYYKSYKKNAFKETAKEILQMGIVSGGVFLILLFVFYEKYGFAFLEETYLYHAGRLDNRHSFSAYFYEIYLNSALDVPHQAKILIRKLPLVYLLTTLSFKYSLKNSMFYLHFLLTFGFVVFNSVITLQYYQWIGTALLLVLP